MTTAGGGENPGVREISMLEILSLTSQLRTKLSMAVDDLLAQLLRGIQMPPSAGK